MAIQAVIFDMDGVLTATVEDHYRSWKKALEGTDITFTRKDNEKLLGLTRHKSLEVILAGRQLPAKEKEEILKRKNEIYLELAQSMSPADLLPGVKELLEELREKRVRLGVASGSSNTHIVLERLGIDGDIQAIIDGNNVKRSKPAPDVFLHVATVLNVQPGDCVVIEDSEAGVQAALTAGMCVIGVGPEQRLKQAHAVFSDLTQLHYKNMSAIHDLWVAVTHPINNNHYPVYNNPFLD